MSIREEVKLYSADGYRLISSDGFHLNTSMEEVRDNVDRISQIPTDAKRAVKDFIEHHFNELCETLSDLDSFNLPIETAEKFPEFIEYLRLAFSPFI